MGAKTIGCQCLQTYFHASPAEKKSFPFNKRVRKIFKTKSKSKYILKDPNLKQLESELINKIGLNVFINNKKNNSGSIYFEYKNLDQLNRIIEIIKINY